MARIRSVHPELCRDDTLPSVSAEAERTFIRLWPHLDDMGRAKDNAKLLKADLYPLHDHVSADDVERDLNELASHGLVTRYRVAGKPYLSVKAEAWGRYQSPRHPTPSKLPGPEDAEAPHEDVGSPTADRRNPPEDVGTPTARVGGGVGEGGGEEKYPVPPESSKSLALVPPTVSPLATDWPEVIFEEWIQATGRTARTVLSPERRRLIQKQLKQYPPEDLMDAVRGCRHSAHHRGENDRGTVYDDIELILRDSKHVEMFRDLQRDPPARPLPKGLQGIAAWLERTAS